MSADADRTTMEEEAFPELPDIPAEYLSGFAGFVKSGGEQTDGVDKTDLTYVLNKLHGLERVPVEEGADGRASQEVVGADEAGDRALKPQEYTNTVFERELMAWAQSALGDQSDE